MGTFIAFTDPAGAVEGLPDPTDVTLLAVLTEAQVAIVGGLHYAVIDGGAAAAPLPVAGITTGDTLKVVMEYGVADRTSQASIPSDGHVQLSTDDTTGERLLVAWA